MEQHGSDLMTMLGQLNDATWSQVLLPLLHQTKSAASFALACKQLRQLCHGHQRRLRLTVDNTSHLGPPIALDTFSPHFPAADDIRFCSGWRTARDAASEMQRLSRLLPALARLPSLSSLELDLVGLGKRGVAAASMVPALQQLQPQLPQLRSLALSLPKYWSGDDRRAWAALGAITQLTKLTLHFFMASFNSDSDDDDSSDEDDFPELKLQRLSALQPLSSSLQHLAVEGLCTTKDQHQDCSFLSSFSALTGLTLPVSSKRSGLAALSSCTGLQQLRLYNYEASPANRGNGLAAAECAAIAQLTLLRYLQIWSVADTAAILAALPSLRGLRTLHLPQMTNAHLSALATLTSLAGLHCCSWAQGAEAGAPPVCASVTCVGISGTWPLAAFPAAKAIILYDSWQPARLAGLSQHMTALERVQVLGDKVPDMHPTLDASASRRERVAAVRSLALLPHLTHLAFTLNDDAEAAALASFCAQLKQLALHQARGSIVTAVGLATVLNKLGKRHSVHLHNLQLHEDDALLLLSGLSSVQRLEVHWDDVEDVEAWEEAAAAAVEAGLPLPADYHFWCV